jgi:hypothetical protein
MPWALRSKASCPEQPRSFINSMVEIDSNQWLEFLYRRTVGADAVLVSKVPGHKGGSPTVTGSKKQGRTKGRTLSPL